MTGGADDLDQAAELTQMMTDSAVFSIQKRSKPQQVQNADGTWPHPDCTECGEEMVMARLQMGRIRCIHCQEVWERREAGL